ncbi:MAG: hypothetical protein M1819_005342 [Sarea resinae]|nr:MAG: hypothetical protein M1819_005342 [Sarea resinae]
MATSDVFRERFEHLKEVQDTKDDLIKELIAEVKSLGDSLEDARSDLEREKTTARVYQGREQETSNKLRQKELEIGCNPFVVVLIDGDCMNFLDTFVKNLEIGGQEAVGRLRSSVFAHLQTKVPSIRRDVEIVVRVYANIKGLSRTYREANILDRHTDFESFVRGFNKGHPLCDFIDAGDGKECSDVKIREQLKLHVRNVHCQHIVFGASADNGYARELGPYSGDEKIRDRISLLEGPPFARELLELAQKFVTASCPTVFRSTKLLATRAPMSVTPPMSPGPSYASTVALVARPGSSGPTPAAPITPQASNIHKGVVAHNSAGQRVDLPLNFSSSLVAQLKTRKLCNAYHLRGFCHFSSCTHQHGPQLNKKQLVSLRYIARLTPCAMGLDCDDEDCVCGHSCPQPLCHYGSSCRFPRQMHGVDRTPVTS